MRWKPGLALVLALSSGACSTNRDIRARDYGAFLPAGRVHFDLYGPRDEPSHTIAELELDFAGVSGDSTDSGVPVGEYRLLEGGATMRLGRQVRDRMRVVGLFGLGVNRIDLIDRAALPFIDDDDTLFGGRGGVEMRLRFTDWLWWHGRFTAFIGSPDMYSLQTEVGLLFQWPDRAGLMIGYKDWRFQDESSDLIGADEVDLRVNGLFVGMELLF